MNQENVNGLKSQAVEQKDNDNDEDLYEETDSDLDDDPEYDEELRLLREHRRQLQQELAEAKKIIQDLQIKRLAGLVRGAKL